MLSKFKFLVILGRPLLHLGLYLFHHHKLVDTFHLDIIKLRQFLIMVEDTYDPINCYHNCTHASDVAQALHCLVSEFKVRQLQQYIGICVFIVVGGVMNVLS